MDVTMSGVSVILHLSLHRLTIKSLGVLLLLPPRTGIVGAHQHAWLSGWVLGINRFSCLHSRH